MKITTQYFNVLFDLDGTLTDPGVGITKSVQYALRKVNIIENNLKSLEKFIGPPLTESFKIYYGLNEKTVDNAIKYYREYFKKTGIFENEIYPGIESLLKELKRNSIKSVVATSKPKIFSKQITDHFNITQYFTAIEGSFLNGKRSDKSELISYILKKYNFNLQNTIMVGDRKHDIIGAKNNGINSIGVGYGYGTAEELTSNGANFYAKTVNNLTDLLLSD